MATVMASDLVNRAQTILQDTTGTRWPQDELLGWLNDAQREVILNRPDANAVNTDITLEALASKQTLPAAALKLIDVICNVNGPSIRKIERRVLDDQIPGWHNKDGGVVEHFIYDERDPKTFYIYPRLTASADITVVFSSAPADISTEDAFPDDATTAATISLDDVYANAILDFILYRAYSKDADYAANANRAIGHYQAFANSMGITSSTDTRLELAGTQNDGTPGTNVVPKQMPAR